MIFNEVFEKEKKSKGRWKVHLEQDQFSIFFLFLIIFLNDLLINVDNNVFDMKKPKCYLQRYARFGFLIRKTHKYNNAFK